MKSLILSIVLLGASAPARAQFSTPFGSNGGGSGSSSTGISSISVNTAQFTGNGSTSSPLGLVPSTGVVYDSSVMGIEISSTSGTMPGVANAIVTTITATNIAQPCLAASPSPLTNGMTWNDANCQPTWRQGGVTYTVLSSTQAGATPGGSPSQVQYNLGGALAGTAGFLVNASSEVLGTAAYGLYASSPLVVMGTAGTAAICQAALEVGTGTRCPQGGANAALILERGPGAGCFAYTDQSDASEALLCVDSSASYSGINISAKPFEIRAGANTSRIRIGAGLGVFVGSGHIDNSNTTLIVRSTSNLPTDNNVRFESSQGNAIFTIVNSSTVFFTTGTLAGIGTNTPTSTLDVIGTIRQTNTLNCATGIQITSTGALQGCVASDMRLKKNIVPLAHKIGSIDDIKTVSYMWKDTTRGLGEKDGMLAQDVEKVWPNVIVPGGNNGMKGLDNYAMIAHIIEEVKALRKRVQELEEKQ